MDNITIKDNKIRINIPEQESNIVFKLGTNEEVLKITKEGFYYKGERVDDIHNVYERFNEWLNGVEKK